MEFYDFEVIDTLTGFSVEPGDIIRTADGFEVTVNEVDHVDGGYNIRYLDHETDEFATLFIDEDEFVELLG